jgi:photosystem II stability/assembly factor-like uncharacterized protein
MQHVKIFIWILGFISMTGMSYAQTGWVFQTNPLGAGIGLGKIQFVSSTEGWISAGRGQLLHTTNAGANWTVVIPFPNDTVMSMADPAITMWWINQTRGWKINWFGTGFSDARGAVIHKTTDGGSTWQKKVLSTAAGDAGLQVQFVDENNGWASIYNFSSGQFKLMRSTDGGNNWNPIIFHGVLGIFYFVDINNGWSMSRFAADTLHTPEWSITHTTDGGVNWSVQYTDNGNTDAQFNALQFTDLNNGWVVGDKGKILKTTNGGNNWTAVTNTGITTDYKSKCLFFLNANIGWIPVSPSTWPHHVVLHTTDGGNSWTQQSFDFNGAIFNINFLDANNGWFSGEQCVQNCNGLDSLKVWAGVISHTTNGGATGVETSNNSSPSGYSLSHNYPNPFNPSTVITYQVASFGKVSLKVFDLLGREVATLVNEVKSAGSYTATFNAANMPSGVYFYRLQSGSFIVTKKLVLLK